MRMPLAPISFVLAVVAGIGLVQFETYVIEKNSPGFTREEASAFVGHRVRNIFWSPRYKSVKWPRQGGRCLDLLVGEQGTVIDIEKQFSQEYFLVVQWDTPDQGTPFVSQVGRKNRRIFLKVD